MDKLTLRFPHEQEIVGTVTVDGNSITVELPSGHLVKLNTESPSSPYTFFNGYMLTTKLTLLEDGPQLEICVECRVHGKERSSQYILDTSLVINGEVLYPFDIWERGEHVLKAPWL